MYCLCVNLIMKMSFEHIHLANTHRCCVTCVLVYALLCLGSHTLPGGSLAMAPHAPPRMTERHVLLLLLPFCNQCVKRGCEEKSELLGRPLSSYGFGIAHVLNRWNNKVTPLSLDPCETVTIECEKFLSCESFFQQRRHTDRHLSSPCPLVPLISDSLECSPMTLPCQSQHR